MSRIYWDTMLFVYLLEGNADHGPRVQEIHSRMEVRGDTLCTGVFTIGELLIGPYRAGANDLASQIKGILRPPAVEVLPFTPETADRFARIRSQYQVTPADSMHLACASGAGVDLFLTNDRRLPKLVIQGIDFIAGLDTNLL